MDTELAERSGACELLHELSPDALFDRRWALALLDQELARLETEHAAHDFGLLKECLTAARGEIDYPQLAVAMETSEGAARVAVHRLRKRYRAVIREEVARTVAAWAWFTKPARNRSTAWSHSNCWLQNAATTHVSPNASRARQNC